MGMHGNACECIRHYLIAEGPQGALRLRLPQGRATVSNHRLDVTILQQDF